MDAPLPRDELSRTGPFVLELTGLSNTREQAPIWDRRSRQLLLAVWRLACGQALEERWPHVSGQQEHLRIRLREGLQPRAVWAEDHSEETDGA